MIPGASGCSKPKFLTRILVINDDATTTEDGAGSTQEVNAGAGAAVGAAGAAAEEIDHAAAPARPPPLQPARCPAWQGRSRQRPEVLSRMPIKLVCLNRSVSH